MARKVFYSFHFDNDFWRTQQVRNIGAIEGQSICSANAWEEVKQKGSAAVEKWIDESMVGKSCVVVLVGSQTAARPWVIKEIIKGYDAGKGVLGIRVNGLLGHDGKSCTAGDNPFDKITLGETNKLLSSVVSLKTPSGADSKAVYASIAANLDTWIEDAIAARK